MEIQPTTRDQVFISYRRNDAQGASGRLYDWLRIAFGSANVFRDVHSIGVGKWRDKIDAALARSAVCVAVIGPRWANVENLARLGDEADMVRHELMTVLACEEIRVVPTLVEGATVPKSDDLPPELRPLLSAWNTRVVTEDGWEDDTRRLISEIAKASGLAVLADVETLLRDVGAAKRRVAELERDGGRLASQVEALQNTISELENKLAVASNAERPELVAAFAALAHGDTKAAEDAFEREYDAQAGAMGNVRRAMVESARNVANLALLRDVKKAVRFYRKALEADPEDVESGSLLGEALMVQGDVAGAWLALSQALASAIRAGDAWGESHANIGCGDVLMAQGDAPRALAAYRRSLVNAKALVKRDPAETRWQRRLFVSYGRIGNVLFAQGDGPNALAAYERMLEIARDLAARDPNKAGSLRDLSSSWGKVGDMLAAQGADELALAAFRRSLEIADGLARCDPANTRWKRELMVCQGRVGNMLVAQGAGPEARAALIRCMEIAEELVACDPANTLWQHDLSVRCNKMGDWLVKRGEVEQALAAYRRSLEIREALAALDPANAKRQVDVALSCARLGDPAHGQSVETRMKYLVRGRDVLAALKSAGRLLPSQDGIAWWFQQQLETGVEIAKD